MTATLTISGPTIVQELLWTNTLLGRVYTAATISSIIADLVSGTGWAAVVDAPHSTKTLSIRFDGKSRWAAILEVANIVGAHVREDPIAKTITIGSFGTAGGFRLLNPGVVGPAFREQANLGIVGSIKVEEDSATLVNSIIPLGQGEGINAFSMRWSTRSVAGGYPYNISSAAGPDGNTYYYLEDAASVAAYGRRQIVASFKDIGPIANSPTAFENASNALYDLCATHLQRRKDPITVYDVAAIVNKAAPILVGDTLRLDYKGVATDEDGERTLWLSVDEDLIILEKAVQYLDSNLSTVRLKVADVDRWLLSDVELIIGELESLGAMRVNVKLYTFVLPHGSFVDSIQTSGSHWLDYEIRYNDAVALLHACWLDVHLSGLKANATAASSGGGSTSGDGGGQTSSSHSGHTHSLTGSTVSVSDHVHTSLAGSTNDANPDTPHSHTLDSSGAAGLDGSHGHSVSGATASSGGSHTHSVDDHNHSVSAHTHGLTYGIFRDTLPSPATWTLWINGVDRTVALGGPWTADVDELDITTYLLDANGHPLRQVNDLQIRTSASKAFDVGVHSFSLVSASAIGAG